MIIGLLTMVTFSTCLRVKKFTAEELKWVNPYSKTDAIIYQSENNELDTIIFFHTDTAYWYGRDLEAGFYNQINLSVRYELTDGSYHQSALMGDGLGKYEHHFVSVTNSSSRDWTSIDIGFFGISYYGKELKNIVQLDDKNYYFDRDKATDLVGDVIGGINNFIFNTDIGVVEYTDIRDVKWIRKEK